MAKSAREQLASNRQSKRVVMDKPFAGIKPGQTMFVATPKIIDQWIKAIPHGETRTIERFRRELARNNECDACCPVSTAIFIRVVAQAAVDDLQDGKPVEALTPVWRLLKSTDKIAKKLSMDAAWLDQQRELETF